MDFGRFRCRPPVCVTFCVCLVAAAASAQQKPLTLDVIDGPATRVNFSGTPAPAFAWIDANHYAWPRTAEDGREAVDWMKVDATSGSSVPLFDAARAEAAIAALPGIAAEDARRIVRSRDLVFNHDFTQAVLTISDDLYLCA